MSGLPHPKSGKVRKARKTSSSYSLSQEGDPLPPTGGEGVPSPEVGTGPGSGPEKPWFRLKARLSFAEWSRAADRGSLGEVRSWLATAEQRVWSGWDLGREGGGKTDELQRRLVLGLLDSAFSPACPIVLSPAVHAAAMKDPDLAARADRMRVNWPLPVPPGPITWAAARERLEARPVALPSSQALAAELRSFRPTPAPGIVWRPVRKGQVTR